MSVGPLIHVVADHVPALHLPGLLKLCPKPYLKRKSRFGCGSLKPRISTQVLGAIEAGTGNTNMSYMAIDFLKVDRTKLADLPIYNFAHQRGGNSVAELVHTCALAD